MEDSCSFSQLLDFIIDHQTSPDQHTSIDSEMASIWKASDIPAQANHHLGSMDNGIQQDSIGEYRDFNF